MGMQGPNSGDQSYLHAPAVNPPPKEGAPLQEVGESMGERWQAWDDEIVKAYSFGKDVPTLPPQCPNL